MWDDEAQGSPRLCYLVTLKDPSSKTWPARDVAEFHDRIKGQAIKFGLSIRHFVRLKNAAADESERGAPCPTGRAVVSEWLRREPTKSAPKISGDEALKIANVEVHAMRQERRR